MPPSSIASPSEETSALLARRLRSDTQGEVLFDAASRGRYATDASIYQIMPVGVLVPTTDRDVALAIDIAKEKGPWYRDTGQGMGPALNTAAGMNAYILSDRGTWLSFKNRGDLTIVVEGDKRLFNQYGVMLVNPQKHPHVKKELGQAFADWLVSPEGQNAIAAYKIDGQQLFFPNANVPGA